jgi:hypothetical protein
VVAFTAGQTAVVVPVPAAEPLVARWRERFDSSAARGVPAHVTVLVPWVDEADLDDAVLARLARTCAGVPAHRVVFREARRVPGVLWLRPEPADLLRGLTLAVAATWPHRQPYGGAFDAVVPHLTVADGVDDATLERVAADLRPGLPVTAEVSEAVLYVFDGSAWDPRARLPLGGR